VGRHQLIRQIITLPQKTKERRLERQAEKGGNEMFFTAKSIKSKKGNCSTRRKTSITKRK